MTRIPEQIESHYVSSKKTCIRFRYRVCPINIVILYLFTANGDRDWADMVDSDFEWISGIAGIEAISLDVEGFKVWVSTSAQRRFQFVIEI